MSERDRLWTARLRGAAAHWRECYATARESVGLALGQIEQITERADRAERRERGLLTALEEVACIDNNDRLDHDEMVSLAMRIAEAALTMAAAQTYTASLAATVQAAPRAVDPDGFDPSEPRMQFASAAEAVAYLKSDDDDEPRAGQPPRIHDAGCELAPDHPLDCQDESDFRVRAGQPPQTEGVS
jgi:hypothetical protein